MMKTALSIIQGFCYRSGVITAPTTLVLPTDPQVLKLLHCLYATCEKLRSARCWVQQKRVYTFNTEIGRAKYPTPTDYFSAPIGTAWNQTEGQRLIGPVDDEYFNALLYDAPSTTNYSFRIFGPDVTPLTEGQVWVNPTPGSIETLSYDYITRNLFLYNGWTTADFTPIETVTADTDVCLFDYDLVQLGLEANYMSRSDSDASIVMAEFDKRIQEAVARVEGPRKGSFTTEELSPQYSTPSGSWPI